jgi:hypothetical protein
VVFATLALFQIDAEKSIKTRAFREKVVFVSLPGDRRVQIELSPMKIPGAAEHRHRMIRRRSLLQDVNRKKVSTHRCPTNLRATHDSHSGWSAVIASEAKQSLNDQVLIIITHEIAASLRSSR